MPDRALEEQISQVIAHAVSQIANLIKADLVALLQPGSGAKRNGVAATSSPKSTSGATKKGGRRGRRGSLDEATVSRVFKVIEDSPGLRSEEIYKKLPLAPEQAKKALAKLRADGRVKTKGEKRATTYAPA